MAARLIEEVSALETLEELEEDNPEESKTPPVSSVLVADTASNSPQPAPG